MIPNIDGIWGFPKVKQDRSPRDRCLGYFISLSYPEAYALKQFPTWESRIIANMKMFLFFALCIGFAASFDLEQIQFSNEGTLEQSSINSG